MSPALWWNNDDLVHRLEKDHGWISGCRIWLDVGTAEGSPQEHDRYVASVKSVENVLKSAEKESKVTIVKDAVHNESAWSNRFGNVLEFLFPYNAR